VFRQKPSQHENLIAAVRQAREMRLCMESYCTTGCIMAFRKLIKEALTGKDADTSKLGAIDPKLRIQLREFCRQNVDFLTSNESYLLREFYTALDPSIPAEAAELQQRKAQQDIEAAQRRESWKELVAERRAKKKHAKADAHALRLEQKKERDREYWATQHTLNERGEKAT
jgi:hypothetical protein